MKDKEIDVDALIAEQDAEEESKDFDRPANAGFPEFKPEDNDDSSDTDVGTPPPVEAVIKVDPQVKEVTVFEYTVGRGENLRHIAARFGTSAAAIAKANHLLSPRHLVRGQVLTIRGKV